MKNKNTEGNLIACLAFTILFIIFLWCVEIPHPGTLIPDDLRLPYILYPQVDGDKYTLSHLKILEVYPDNYSRIADDDLCIIFRGEVITDLHDVLKPGTVVFVRLYPNQSPEGNIEDILAAGKEHLSVIDSCFIYGTPKDAEDAGTYYTADGELFADISGVLLRPDIDDGGFLPIVDGTVDAEALERIWEFPIDRHDGAFSKARNMEQLLKVLEEHTDPQYYKKREELYYQELIAKNERARKARPVLLGISYVISAILLISLCVVKKRNKLSLVHEEESEENRH